MSQQEQGKGLISCRALPVAESWRASFFFFFRGRGGRGLRGRGMREGGDDFGGGGFADLAVAVVDGALRESVLAAAGEGFRGAFVECGKVLFRRLVLQIEAGKIACAVDVLQEKLAGLLR